MQTQSYLTFATCLECFQSASCGQRVQNECCSPQSLSVSGWVWQLLALWLTCWGVAGKAAMRPVMSPSSHLTQASCSSSKQSLHLTRKASWHLQLLDLILGYSSQQAAVWTWQQQLITRHGSCQIWCSSRLWTISRVSALARGLYGFHDVQAADLAHFEAFSDMIAHLNGVKPAGEEAKVILVSLVRSNDQGKAGFLSETNRINVLLSR